MKTILLIGITTLMAMQGLPLAAQPAAEEMPELASVLSLFSAYASAGDGVRLNWTLDKQSPTIRQFRLYRGYDDVGNFAVLADVDAYPAADAVDYSYRDETARAGVSYYYKLSALGQSSESVFPVVITATPPPQGQETGPRDLLPVSILPGEKIMLYVRQKGRITLTAMTEPPKELANDVLRAGIYEFEPPPGMAAGTVLKLSNDHGYAVDIAWPVK